MAFCPRVSPDYNYSLFYESNVSATGVNAGKRNIHVVSGEKRHEADISPEVVLTLLSPEVALTLLPLPSGRWHVQKDGWTWRGHGQEAAEKSCRRECQSLQETKEERKMLLPWEIM